MGPWSAPQYLSAVLRYHEDSGFESTTKKPFFSRVLKSYANNPTAKESLRAQKPVWRRWECAKLLSQNSARILYTLLEAVIWCHFRTSSNAWICQF